MKIKEVDIRSIRYGPSRNHQIQRPKTQTSSRRNDLRPRRTTKNPTYMYVYYSKDRPQLKGRHVLTEETPPFHGTPETTVLVTSSRSGSESCRRKHQEVSVRTQTILLSPRNSYLSTSPKTGSIVRRKIVTKVKVLFRYGIVKPSATTSHVLHPRMGHRYIGTLDVGRVI